MVLYYIAVLGARLSPSSGTDLLSNLQVAAVDAWVQGIKLCLSLPMGCPDAVAGVARLDCV